MPAREVGPMSPIWEMFNSERVLVTTCSPRAKLGIWMSGSIGRECAPGAKVLTVCEEVGTRPWPLSPESIFFNILYFILCV